MEEVPEALWVERGGGAEDEGGDAVFFGFGEFVASHDGEPARGGGGVFEVEAAGTEDGWEGDIAVGGWDDFGARVDECEGGFEGGEVFWWDEIGFIEDDDVAEFDLVDEEVGDGAGVGVA